MIKTCKVVGRLIVRHARSLTWDVVGCGWVGIIMYLPTEDAGERQAITDAFARYAQLCEAELMPKYNAKWHWAKLEPGADRERLARVQRYLKQQYDVRRFNHVRHTLDPSNNMGNKWLNDVLPLTRGS